MEQKFDEMLQRLERIVQGLEGGEMSLEDSLKVFEEGMQLVSACAKKLEEAERKVTLLVKESSGRCTERPFEPDDAVETENGTENLSQ